MQNGNLLFFHVSAKRLPNAVANVAQIPQLLTPHLIKPSSHRPLPHQSVLNCKFRFTENQLVSIL